MSSDLDRAAKWADRSAKLSTAALVLMLVLMLVPAAIVVLGVIALLIWIF